MSRIGWLVLAGWYALASTGVVYGVLDALAPQTKTVAVADFPCAQHDCGCKTAEQCRLRCCCHPKSRPDANRQQLCHLPERTATTVAVSAWSEARCRGHQDAASPWASKLGPHLPVGCQPLVAVAAVQSLRPAPTVALSSASRDLPDKIPI